MADVKISALPASTAPLAGTEVLPIVQSGATVKVAVNQLSSFAPAFRAYNTGIQSIGASTATKVVFGTEEFDTNSNYNNSTYRFTPTVAGYYLLNTGVFFSAASVVNLLSIYKNNSVYASFSFNGASNIYNGGVLVYANGSTDYFEVFAISFSGANILGSAASSGDYMWFAGSLVRGA